MPARASLSVLADRIAANLIHHEPGWRLPRQSALARRFNASALEIDAALEALVDRHLIRRLPDGQLYRASPVDSLIRLGMPGLGSHIDPMGAVITQELPCPPGVHQRKSPWPLESDPNRSASPG
jgi:hypothetical protein